MTGPPGLVLLDIEGTTTPITFVTGTLFPFARARLEDAAHRAARDPRLAEAFSLLRKEHATETEGGASLAPFGIGAAFAERLMDEDRKSTGLKALQGVLWEEGYRSGELRGAVFQDVAPALVRWTDAGASVRIYSSGSVLAQQLLFAHSEVGDLTSYLSGYYDTRTGPKREPDSYRAIAADSGIPAGDTLFLSDVVAELDAARAAGMSTGLMTRPGNPPQPASDHPAYRSFSEIS